ncbi:hypothetical protein DL768_003109 [Monosporascus sp. mg162]|nr:hypothetical protein DL768_003109 [Monosporascus sp. mg162]
MEHDSDGENDALVSKVWFERFGKCVPDGVAALEENQSRAKKPVKSSKRCGVIFDSAWSQTSVPYPETKDEWGSFINVLRLVTQSCEHVTPEDRRAKKRLSMALNEKEETEELREQAQYEADKKRGELEALMARQEGFI